MQRTLQLCNRGSAVTAAFRRVVSTSAAAAERADDSSKIYNSMRMATPRRPADKAFFTGNPDYFKMLRQVNQLIRAHNLTSPKNSKPTPGSLPSWMSIDEFRSLRSYQLNTGMYLDLITKLNKLYSVQEKDPEVAMLLSQCIRPGELLQAKKVERAQLDDMGRSHTRGSRKSARAQCWMVEGQGHIYVNGVEFSNYFAELGDRERIIKPLEVVDGLGKYNVWGLVSGGGPSGQAGALAVAVARGIATHDPACDDVLSKLGLTKIDRRQVERKKTGQPKARKKNAWVKR